jgi:hypothetical protein
MCKMKLQQTVHPIESPSQWGLQELGHCLALPCTSFNTKYISASFQPEMKLGPNSQTRPVWTFK